MPESVRISDELMAEARIAAAARGRSIFGQIEFWAQLGRAIEPPLDGRRLLALQRSGAAMKDDNLH